MFRPPSLLASQIVPTAASFPAGQPRLLRPSRTCVVTFARIGYALRPTTGNWRNEDFNLARFTALSTAPYSPLVGDLSYCDCRLSSTYHSLGVCNHEIESHWNDYGLGLGFDVGRVRV